MESKLPKPKFTFKKVIGTLNANLETNVTVKPRDGKTADNALTNKDVKNDTETMKKSQSTQNVAASVSEDFVVSRRPLLRRSKTHTAITRNLNTAKVAVKRAATTTETCENKRPNIKAGTKPTVAPKTLRTATTIAATKNSNATSSKVAAKQRPKWDLKGRLEEASNELATTKEKHKSITQKNSELQSQIETLRKKEEASRIRADEYESKCTELTLEVTTLQNKNTSLKNTCDNLSKQREHLEEDLGVAQSSLKKYQEKCRKQEIELLEHTRKLENLEIENESHQSTIEQLSRMNEDLQNMVHSMDKDRRQLHNMIQELKGNIRVFCRVRPKINKEISKG